MCRRDKFRVLGSVLARVPRYDIGSLKDSSLKGSSFDLIFPSLGYEPQEWVTTYYVVVTSLASSDGNLYPTLAVDGTRQIISLSSDYHATRKAPNFADSC